MRKGWLVLSIFVVASPWSFFMRTEPLLARAPKKARLLYMTLSAGYKHDTVPLSKEIVKEMGDKSGAFETTLTEEVAVFTADNLKNYDAVMFNTTGELPMTEEQKRALCEFVRSGHGFVGVHSAAASFYLWEEFAELLGGYFNGHPWHEVVTVEVADPSSELVGFLGRSFQINDEIFQIADFRVRDSHVLLKLDPSSVDQTKPGVWQRYYGWPLAWTRRYGKGRVYYNGLGHDDWVWQDSRYQEMLRRGITWAMGRGN